METDRAAEAFSSSLAGKGLPIAERERRVAEFLKFRWYFILCHSISISYVSSASRRFLQLGHPSMILLILSERLLTSTGWSPSRLRRAFLLASFASGDLSVIFV